MEQKRNPVALIVDNEPVVRRMVRSMLHLYGFTVLEAESAEEAARVSGEYEGTIDLAVVDHPLRNDFLGQAVDRIKKHHPDIRVLRYSGYPLEELQRTGSVREDSAFIQKPFRADQFMAKVKEVMGWLPEKRRTSGGGEGA